MSEHVYYSEPQWILYRLPDSTHITQTIAGNTLVTELPQYSSELVSKRKTQISANGLIYNNLHGNQCNNFHIPNSLDFLWNSNVRKRPFTNKLWPSCPCGLTESCAKIRSFFELNKFLWDFFQKRVFRKACGAGKWNFLACCKMYS